jgi:hypothetical protein
MDSLSHIFNDPPLEMLHLRPLAVMYIVASASSSYITGRDFTALAIDGNNVP